MDTVKSSTRNGSLKNMTNTALFNTEPTSLSTLIVWNITKALETSPTLNIKEAVVSAQTRLEQVSDAGDIQTILSDDPYERHLACALLAWYELGHRDADSLCRFVENKTKNGQCPSMLSSNIEPFENETLSQTSKGSRISSKIVALDIGSVSQDSRESRYEEARCFSSFNSFSMGPVIKLPVETQVVMRLDNTPRCGGRTCGPQKKPRAPEKDIINKINQACCMDSVCGERLAAMDATTAELRARAGTLARREAERVVLLERAEAAWKDLELGYQRRLALSEEKEEDISKQITRMLEERVNYKNACTTMAQELRDRSGRAEVERARLTELEKSVCERACQRMRASEESARGDSLVAEQSCRAAQLDRDLQFKEEQARRNMVNLQSEVAAVRALSSEAERATRSELSALRDQIAEVSNKLLDEDAHNEETKAQLEDLRQEKMEIIEDLEGCKVTCDGMMQGRLDDLVKKGKQLVELKEKVMECRCKVPIDIAVEAKRTPSLAALCKCTPEDKILECCSCTSLRTKLLSNLFEDLFGGLQAELSGEVILMPCQLLKCLEDKHNWDRASVIKSNLKNYFSKLLVGELDIAIATSIENYHAKWVGISCADAIKIIPGPEDDPESDGWQERAIERRAQKLASQLAEQLFRERADELTQRAHDIVNAGPPPCECDLKAKLPEGCSCGTKPPSPTPALETETQVYWHQATQDVTQLRYQMEDLKKDSFKKDEVKAMEDKFERIIQLLSIGGPAERDLHDEVKLKCGKKSHGKALGTKKKYETVKNAADDDSVACSSVIKKTLAAPAVPAYATPFSWQQDVTLLRHQIEELQKESIKKEDLKMMEDKIAKIVHRASGSKAATNSKMKHTADGHLANEATKYSKLNRAFNKTDFNKNKFYGSLSKEINEKPMSSRLINKPYRKTNPAFAVNMCLCSTKRQEQKELNERRKVDTSPWKQKFSKNTVSQISSSMRQSKPYNSFLSQDISARTYSEDYDENSCRSNCVCFHKIPSNTSIDKLLETLAKWKGDLDASFLENYPHKTSCCNNTKSHLDNNNTFASKTSLKSQNISIQKKEYLRSNQGSDHKISFQPSNTKTINIKDNTIENMSAKSTEPVAADSVYMGAVNLDKSHEELCECDKSKKNKRTPFKCIASSWCNCEQTLKTRKVDGRILQVKKEKQKEISVIQTKQGRRAKEIIVLPNTPINENTIKTQSLKNDINSNIEINSNKTEEKTDIPAFSTSDYQIHFLGVTLVDVNPKTKNQVLLVNDNSGYNIDYNCDKYQPNIMSENDHHDYSEKSSRPVLEVENHKHNVDYTNRNILLSKHNKDEYPNCFINNEVKRKELCKTYYVNEHRSDHFSKNSMMLNNMDGTDIKQLHKNIKYKNSDLGYKTASDHNTSNVGCFNNQSQKLYVEVNADGINSHESEVSKKSFITAESENNTLFYKSITEANDSEKNLSEAIIKKNQSISSHQNIKTAPIPQMLACACNVKLEDFKKSIKADIEKNTDNEDVALDIQSLKHFKERDDSCICCSKLNNDNCRDLEDNTFHLLEEYLKNKLNELRASTCSSYRVPVEEEEKVFSLIVQRVKRIISDSTNQVACKCVTEERKLQGSWNRAYGLLQEYLKIKIKKVQCSCLLAEDNKDTILPDVLEKISNLIEYDFQRLKNICSRNKLNTQANKNNSEKQVNFEAEVLEKDQDVIFQETCSNISPMVDHISLSACQSIQSNYLKLPLTLAMKEESCNPQKRNKKNFILNASFNSLDKRKNCDNTAAVTNVDSSDKKIDESKIAIGVSSNITDCTKTTHKTNAVLTSEHVKKNSSANVTTEKINTTKTLEHPSDDLKEVDSKENLNTSTSSCNKVCHQKSAVNNHFKTNSDGNRPKTQESSISNSCKMPYLGYTITCSCEETLGPCICPKNISNANTDMINDIWNKSILDETFFNKISYILPKHPIESVIQNVNSQETFKMSKKDDSLKLMTHKIASNKSEATCCIKIEPIVLKTSTYDVIKVHTETNTFNDSASVDTDCSNNEDVDWCECTSQFNPSKHVVSDRLRRSIYFPAPIVDNDELSKDDMLSENAPGRAQKHVCDCEKVPICHVKMLVENIETKLANASCTCDSMVAKVCPVHSQLC